MSKLYASLTGPLLDLYFPCPARLDGDEVKFRVALNTSKLAKLWCSIYTEAELGEMESSGRFNVTRLPDEFGRKLDYDSHEVSNVDKWVSNGRKYE